VAPLFSPCYSHRGGLRAWDEADFERGLAVQQDQAVTGLRVGRELRRSRLGGADDQADVDAADGCGPRNA